jgi:2',3'-cyclic-nucleotide 2'-phosphodiesterase (5'-nucleotidase family)
MTADGVTVVWTTNKKGTGRVELIANEADTTTRICYAATGGHIRAARTLHHVRISSLQPDATYRYRVYSRRTDPIMHTLSYGRTAASSNFSFTTYAKESKDISFLILNDIHSRAKFMKDLCRAVDFKSLDFVCFNGDMWEWMMNKRMLFKGCMDAAVELFATETPLVFNRGNHETRGPYAEFLPDYFPTCTGQVYGMFSAGNICFLTLDCGEDKEDSHREYFGLAAFDTYREEEAAWLKQCVETEEFKAAAARIVFLHIPPTTSGGHGSRHLEKILMPILNKANIDIMFSGHNHRYSYHEPNDRAAFPIVVNGNNTYVLCTITDGSMKINITGKNPSENHTIIRPIGK